MEAINDPYQNEVTVCPHPSAGWRIELPRSRGAGLFVVVVKDEMSALRLASILAYGKDVRFLRE
jgi:hypothetical protein